MPSKKASGSNPKADPDALQAKTKSHRACHKALMTPYGTHKLTYYYLDSMPTVDQFNRLFIYYIGIITHRCLGLQCNIRTTSRQMYVVFG